MHRHVLSPWLLGAALLLACSGRGRPPPAGEEIDGQTSSLAGKDDDPYDDLPPPQVCLPRSTRECRYYYVEPSGRLACPLAQQHCRADGLGWRKCGAGPDDAGAPDVPSNLE